jgi:hypothetical protein
MIRGPTTRPDPCFTRFEKLGESVPELAQACYVTGGLYDKDEI